MISEKAVERMLKECSKCRPSNGGEIIMEWDVFEGGAILGAILG